MQTQKHPRIVMFLGAGQMASNNIFLVSECVATDTWGDTLKYVQKRKRDRQIDTMNDLAETNKILGIVLVLLNIIFLFFFK